jgi:SAM-dependent methyltransferase
MASICNACQSPGPHTIYVFREMMFGTRDEFEYFECKECGSIQRMTAVGDEAKFYPSNYYSFGNSRSSTRSGMLAIRDSHAFGRKSAAGAILSRIWPLRNAQMQLLPRFNLTARSRILDVGCGSGAILQRLAAIGFQDLTGVDPFLKAATPSGPVRLLKADIEEIGGRFDFIMFNHSLEHVLNPEATLSAARRLLSETGHCLVRIPTCSSFAWQHYGRNWVQLDPPRHVVIFSRDGLSRLAARVGFRLDATIDDSSEFQFTGSERYCRDIPLREPGHDLFGRRELRAFRARALELNRQSEGDQAAFVLSPSIGRAGSGMANALSPHNRMTLAERSELAHGRTSACESVRPNAIDRHRAVKRP